jgi:hypothetical protein
MPDELETFDEEKVYDEQIAPLITKIIMICMKHKIPMAATFQYAYTGEEGGHYVTTTLPFEGRVDEQINTVMVAMKPRSPKSIAVITRTDPVTGKKSIEIQRIE